MSLKKEFLEETSECKVTFRLDKDIGMPVHWANLAGDFNNWNEESMPMKKHLGRYYSISVDLLIGREYQFKYIIDGFWWLNEKEADKFVENEFQGFNSVVIL